MKSFFIIDLILVYMCMSTALQYLSNVALFFTKVNLITFVFGEEGSSYRRPCLFYEHVYTIGTLPRAIELGVEFASNFTGLIW